MEKFGYVYIMTNKNKTVLYIGVTNNLVRRVYEHKNHIVKNSFSDKYNCEYCIYYEEFMYFDLAIAREKELKKWNRQKKETLINRKNPEWRELVTDKGFVRTMRDSSPAERGFERTATDSLPAERGFERTATDSAPAERGFEGTATDSSPAERGFERTATDSSPAARNDGAKSVIGEVGGGGEAAASYFPSSLQTERVIPNGTEWNEETNDNIAL
jgi:putative endonuclease